MRVIATAGHVDHGKSTLVQALTGINPDRLAEEQARQMTIDLGFAWLQMPDGETVGVVDVPGHEDFIENMLAGVGGIDAALLIVAADEGVMPQTREHLAILNLLKIPRLVVALTKIDSVKDVEWLELVQLDIAETLTTTYFRDAPIVPVSAHTGQGLQTLIDILATALHEVEIRRQEGIPRLPVDRVFTLSGFGTIATGTLQDGVLRVGDAVEILPAGIRGRIRGLQAHNQSVEMALPGSRTAVNISGIDKRDIKRGDLLTLPDWLAPSQLLDVEFQHLPEAPRPFKHNTEVKIFIGPSESSARIRLLFDEALPAGAKAWAQIQLDSPLPVINGQRFIVRIPSPPATIGGGVVLDTHPGQKWRRYQDEVQARFTRLASGSPFELVSERLIRANRPLRRAELGDITFTREADEALFFFGEWVVHHQTVVTIGEKIRRLLQRFHEEEPLQQGMPLPMLRTRLRMEPEVFEVLLAALVEGSTVSLYRRRLAHLPEFKVHYSRSQQAAIDRLFKAFRDNPYSPPSVKEAVAEIGQTALDALIKQGDLVRLGGEVLLSAEVYQEWLRYAHQQLKASIGLRAGEFRDAFNTSRKYVLAFLDHLESLQLTRRVDDVHVASHGDWTKVLDSDLP